GEQADPVTTHARIFRRHIIAQPVAAEDVVLGLRHLGRRDAGAHGLEPGIERLLKYAKALQLKLARFADHERAAYLGVIALDARCQFGRDQVAVFENLAGWRRHAAYLAATDADDHEILVDALRTEEPFGLGDQLKILASGPRCRAEDLVTAI